jgi:hypothetical protein
MKDATVGEKASSPSATMSSIVTVHHDHDDEHANSSSMCLFMIRLEVTSSGLQVLVAVFADRLHSCFQFQAHRRRWTSDIRSSGVHPTHSYLHLPNLLQVCRRHFSKANFRVLSPCTDTSRQAHLHKLELHSQ